MCMQIIMFPSIHRLAFAIAAVILFGSIHVAVAQISNPQGLLYFSSFENSIWTVGSQLLGTDGWTTAIPPFLNPAAATITDTASAKGRQSVEVRGMNLVGSGGITAPYDAVGSYRRPLSYTMKDNQPIAVVEGDLLLETGAPLTSDDFFSMTLAARSGNGETLGEFGLSSMGVAEAYAFDAPPGSLPLFTTLIIFNRWYHVAMALDFTNRTTSYYLDGVLLGTTPAPSASDVLLRGAMVVYALPDTAVSVRSDYPARFDGFWVQVGP